MDETGLNKQVHEDNEISRREAIKGSVVALGACYLAPATMNLLLADKASAQGSGGEEETFNSELRCCNFLPNVNDIVTVDYIDVFGPGTEDIPGGSNPDQGTSRSFPDLLDGGEVTLRTANDVYFIPIVPEEVQALESAVSTGDSRVLQSMLSNINQAAVPKNSLTLTLEDEKKCIVVSEQPPS
jgi:hypothetical protein